MDTNVMAQRLARVLRFDASVYREIASDQGAMGQAAVVVVIAAILSALGSFSLGVGAVIVLAIASIVGFAVYSAVATLVSRSLFKGKTDFQEMGRTLGYAYAWYGLGVLGLIPFGGVLAWLGQIVAAIAGVIALRESSEFDTVKAVVTVVIAAVVAGIITVCAAGPVLTAIGLGSAAAQ